MLLSLLELGVYTIKQTYFIAETIYYGGKYLIYGHQKSELEIIQEKLDLIELKEKEIDEKLTNLTYDSGACTK